MFLHHIRPQSVHVNQSSSSSVSPFYLFICELQQDPQRSAFGLKDHLKMVSKMYFHITLWNHFFLLKIEWATLRIPGEGREDRNACLCRLKFSVIVTFWLDENIQGLLGCVSQSSFLTLWTMRGAAWWPLNLTWSTQRWCTRSQQIWTKVITPESLYLPVYLLPQPLILFDEKEDNRHFTLALGCPLQDIFPCLAHIPSRLMVQSSISWVGT